MSTCSNNQRLIACGTRYLLRQREENSKVWVWYLSGVLDVPVVDKGKAPAASRVAVQNHLHLIQVTKSGRKYKEIEKF